VPLACEVAYRWICFVRAKRWMIRAILHSADASVHANIDHNCNAQHIAIIWLLQFALIIVAL
jgi:hypothetical protein